MNNIQIQRIDENNFTLISHFDLKEQNREREKKQRDHYSFNYSRS